MGFAAGRGEVREFWGLGVLDGEEDSITTELATACAVERR